MAYTYSKLGTYTVGSSGITSVSFLNIPQNYSDLLIKISARITRPGTSTDIMNVSFNGTSTNESCRRFESNGSNVSSATNSLLLAYNANGTGATANTFGNGELYIPNYTSSNYKSFSNEGVAENNATTAYMGMAANLWSDTAPINSITFAPDSGTDFVQYSTFHLYGIKAEV